MIYQHPLAFLLGLGICADCGGEQPGDSRPLAMRPVSTSLTACGSGTQPDRYGPVLCWSWAMANVPSRH